MVNGHGGMSPFFFSPLSFLPTLRPFHSLFPPPFFSTTLSPLRFPSLDLIFPSRPDFLLGARLSLHVPTIDRIGTCRYKWT
jgi:hypothetical protein